MRSIRLVLAMAGAAGLVAALPVRAQLPDQTNGLSDQVIIGGQVFNFPEGTNFSQFAPAFFPAPGLANGAVLLFEPNAAGGGTTNISDQLWVQNGFFYFASDPDLQNLDQLGIPVLGSIVESGLPQDVSDFFHLPPGSIQVVSDVIPEPSAFMLVGFGLAALVAVNRRRRA